MVGRGVWRAPGLAVDGKVVSRGKPLSATRVADLIRAARQTAAARSRADGAR